MPHFPSARGVYFSICWHQTRCNEVISKRQTAGALFSRPAVLLTFSSSALAADFPFHFAASPGTHFVGAAPKLPPQHRPCRCEKMGNGMRNCSRHVTHLGAGGNFQFSRFPSGIELFSVRCRQCQCLRCGVSITCKELVSSLELHYSAPVNSFFSW
jgi:hypothetical protein